MRACKAMVRNEHGKRDCHPCAGLSLGITPWWMLFAGVAYYVWYIVEWMIKGVYYTIMIDEWTCDLETPYESISFEREARKAEKDANYLENSRYFAWLKEL